MGSLIGHVVPGTAFGLLAIWWTFDYFLRFYEDLFRGKSTSCIRSRPSCMALASKWPPWETNLRLLMVLVGMAGEYVTALDDNLRFHSMHNAQHITMFAFFLFPVIFDLLHFYRVPGIPPNMDLVAGAVAFAVEGVLFFWHLHGRTNMDVQVHTFQLYAIVMCALFSALEVFFPSDLRLALLRAGFTLLQGSWFYCIGLVLYPPSGWERWDQDDHRQMMLVTMMFTWNVAGIVVFQMLVGAVCYSWVQRRMRLLGVNVRRGAAKARMLSEMMEEDEVEDEDGSLPSYAPSPARNELTLNLLEEEEEGEGGEAEGNKL